MSPPLCRVSERAKAMRFLLTLRQVAEQNLHSNLRFLPEEDEVEVLVQSSLFGSPSYVTGYSNGKRHDQIQDRLVRV